MTTRTVRDWFQQWSPLFQGLTLLVTTGILGVAVSLTWIAAKRDTQIESNTEGITQATADLRELSRTVASLAITTGNNSLLLDERSKKLDQLVTKVEALQDRMAVLVRPSRS